MTIFQLEDALVEFFIQNTSDMEYMTSNEQAPDIRIAPQVRSGFVPRSEAGEIIPGDITTYPSIVLYVREGEQKDLPGSDINSGWNVEHVVLEVLIGVFDNTLNQQGYRDCINIVQRLKDRVREQDIIRERFKAVMPIRYMINRKYVGQGGMNSFPLFFAEMYFTFLVPVMATQFESTRMSGDKYQGIYNETPIPSLPPVDGNGNGSNGDGSIVVPPGSQIVLEDGVTMTADGYEYYNDFRKFLGDDYNNEESSTT